jgi:large subunit ribosomal protein L6
MKQDITEEIVVPAGVEASYENGVLHVKGPKGEVSRRLQRPRISLKVADGKVLFEALQATQREKRHLYTMRSHAKNLLKGVSEGFTYKLKVCSGHFPMNITISGDLLTVKNFLGEAVPRKLKLKEGAQVKLDGDIIVVSSPDVELAGSQASDIEQLTRITNRDRRIFQDGLYIIEKDGVAIR